MKVVKSILTILCISLLFSCRDMPAEDFSSYDQLREGFLQPTGTARPKVYWWWLNGHTDTARMKEELQAMKNAGIGGMDIFEIGFRPDGIVPAGPAFMGDSSLADIVFAIKEASRLGLEVGLNLSSSWNAGGRWITPQHSAKSLYCSQTNVGGTGSKKIKLPFPEVPKVNGKGKSLLIEFDKDGKPVFRQEVAVLALPRNRQAHSLDTAHILDLTGYFDPATEMLQWNVPEGEWDIYRYVCSSSGEQLKLPSPSSVGPIIDHFDSSATRVHFMYFIDRLQSSLGDLRETGLKNLYLASFEATGRVWTPSAPDEFRKINGYGLVKFLPYFFDKDIFDPQAAEKFKQDFDLTISELIINNHYRKGSEIARQYGLKLISEAGGPGPPLHNAPVDALKALGSLDVPRGEFWINHARYDGRPDSIDLLMLVKEIAAASHIYQRKIAELEAFTSFQNWQEGPGDMKPIGDRAFCEGMSRPVIHGFTHNPAGTGYPGTVYHAGTHYNDKNTWWAKAKPFNDYLSRISYIFQEAAFTADVLYYYGDRTPNFATPKNTRFSVGSGYDYEIINTEILLKDVQVKDGKLTLPGGASFRVLALGEITGNIPGVWEKIQALAKAGAIITGIKPAKMPAVLSAENWVAPSVSGFSKEDLDKGKILFNLPVINILNALEIAPDFNYAEKGSGRLDFQHTDAPLLDYIHYKKGSLDFYFIRNTQDKWVSRQCSFRQENKSPEYWDPVSGTISPVTVYKQDGQQINLPLSLPPYGSCFVVFNKQNTTPHYNAIAPVGQHPPILTYTTDGLVFSTEGEYELLTGTNAEKVTNRVNNYPVTGLWKLDFAEGWGAPTQIDLPALISWTESKEPGVRYFSGTATYRNTFEFTPDQVSSEGERIYLDLGNIGKVAEVWWNDKPLGITWTKPYRFDITDAIKKGQNQLKIEVSNTWSNRIVGDVLTGEKYTSTNLDQFSATGIPWKETPLIESGLLGPVTVQRIKVVP